MRHNGAMRSHVSPYMICAGTLALLSACASSSPTSARADLGGLGSNTPPQSHSGHSLVLATLYNNTSAEFAAASLGIFRSAKDVLPALEDDPLHTAVLEQEPTSMQPSAIILDVDETVLDNSPFEVRLIEDGTSYPEGWDEWCNESSAKPIPGALEFTNWADSVGVTVFYVTNRKAHLEEGTRRNLAARGFPLLDDVDTLLMRGERETWTSDKTSRRAHVAKNYRVLMLFGDNLGDFVDIAAAKGTPAERAESMSPHASKWGRSWFMIPNPMYGYWDAAVLDDDYNRPEREVNSLRVQAMDSMR